MRRLKVDFSRAVLQETIVKQKQNMQKQKTQKKVKKNIE